MPMRSMPMRAANCFSSAVRSIASVPPSRRERFSSFIIGQMEKVNQAMTLQEAQQMVNNWISQFEEGYWSPLSNLARLMEEVGELSRELNHRYGEKPKKP